MTIQIELVPSGIGRYVAMLDGSPIIKATRQPFFNAARALLALDHDPAIVMEAHHQGSTTVAMRSTIGEAAKWMIQETDRGGLTKRRWKPFEGGPWQVSIGSPAAEDGSAGV